MRRLSTLTFAAALAATSIGCSTPSNTNVNSVAKNANTNGNVAVVVNNNSNAVVNANKSTANVTREEYDKDRAKYEAEKGASTIGQGANDSWIWFKAKGALATADGLRDSTINVDVDKDIITLKGTVANADQKELAEKTAKGIDGQKGVKNELKVQANDSMTNQMVNGNTAKTSNSNANMKK